MSVLYDDCIWIVTEMSVDAWSVLVLFCLLDDVSYVRLSRESPGRTGHHRDMLLSTCQELCFKVD